MIRLIRKIRCDFHDSRPAPRRLANVVADYFFVARCHIVPDSVQPASNPLHRASAYRAERLLAALLKNNFGRNVFAQWEIDMLVDITTCDLPKPTFTKALKGYVALIRRLRDDEVLEFPKFSEFVRAMEQKKALRISKKH
jgi:hypothetical protein